MAPALTTSDRAGYGQTTGDGRDGKRKSKVAIIGSGLAGLSAAHLLTRSADVRDRFEVHLFERNRELGLDASSITVEDIRIDVPMRSVNAGECGPCLRVGLPELIIVCPFFRLLPQSHEAL